MYGCPESKGGLAGKPLTNQAIAPIKAPFSWQCLWTPGSSFKLQFNYSAHTEDLPSKSHQKNNTVNISSYYFHKIIGILRVQECYYLKIYVQSHTTSEQVPLTASSAPAQTSNNFNKLFGQTKGNNWKQQTRTKQCV